MKYRYAFVYRPLTVNYVCFFRASGVFLVINTISYKPLMKNTGYLMVFLVYMVNR